MIQTIKEIEESIISKSIAYARENINLKTKMTQLEKLKPVVSGNDEKLRIENGELRIEIKKGYEKNKDLIAKFKNIQSIIRTAEPKIIENIQKLFKDIGASVTVEEIKEPYKYEIKFLDKNNQELKPKTNPPTFKSKSESYLRDGSLQLGKCAFEIVKFLAVKPDKTFSKAQIGAMTGYAPNGGSFNNSISELNTKGLIRRSGSNMGLSEAGVDYLIMHNISPGEGEFSPRIWLEKLPVASKKIFEVLIDNPSNEFSKPELGELTGYEPNGGSFNNAISKLCVLGLAERVNSSIRLNNELLEEMR